MRKCDRCPKIINDKEEAILIVRGVWDDKTGKVKRLQENNVTRLVLCKQCFRDITYKPSIKGRRTGFYRNKI